MPSTAKFITKHNRFVGSVDLDGKEEKVLIPNTGRLAELLVPGAEILLSPYQGKYRYRLTHVLYRGSPVYIDSIAANGIFGRLLSEKNIPGMEGFSVARREPPYGNHRFDFLVSRDGADSKEIFLEVKSCTLAWNGVAAFPDAVSSRAAGHVRALAETGGMLVFFILHQGVKRFIPNFHTDFAFYETLLMHQNDIDIRGYSAVYDDSFRIAGVTEVEMHIPDVKPAGSYLLVMACDGSKEIEVGKLGRVILERGFYLYAGSGMNNLFKRIERHRSRQKAKRWHIDYLKEHVMVKTDIPIVEPVSSECRLAGFLKRIGGAPVSGFGSSDCSCRSHLFYFRDNPSLREKFWDFVMERRYGIYKTGPPKPSSAPE